MALGIPALKEYFGMNSSPLISIVCPSFRGRFEGIGRARQGSNLLKIFMSIFDQSGFISVEEIEYSDISPMFLVVAR